MKKQKGFGVLGVVIVLVVLGIVGFVGWRVSRNDNNETTLAQENKVMATYRFAMRVRT